ncbi:MAG: hypothetical protein LQ337_008922 [Flavoplaca oasis]|nr:MAG: hypothetical protein LQ337_008922 [Flavoplaca oasis]
MLGKANYIALVGGGKNPKFPINKLIIWDDAKQFAAVTLEFPTQVLQSRLSRSQILSPRSKPQTTHPASAASGPK